MAMIQCDKGHFYNQSEHSSCPFCGTGLNVSGETQVKKLEQADGSQDVFVRPGGQAGGPVQGQADGGQDVFVRPGGQAGGPVQGQTIAIIRDQIGIDPVVGWFVCVEGADRGRDYRIRSEQNFIGRSEKMDINIAGDDGISRERHAIVSFDPISNTFYILPGESRGMIYLNGSPVLVATQLKLHDTVRLGKTTLLFVPLCGEQFQWTEKKWL